MDHNYYTDHLGMVVSLADENGRKVAEYEYSPFGEVLIAKGGRAKHNFYTFTGREYLERLGMFDYRARIYDPRVGRFVEVDPLTINVEINQNRFFESDKLLSVLVFETNKNRYIYVSNNPSMFVDPSGKIAKMGRAIATIGRIFTSFSVAFALLRIDQAASKTEAAEQISNLINKYQNIEIVKKTDLKSKLIDIMNKCIDNLGVCDIKDAFNKVAQEAIDKVSFKKLKEEENTFNNKVIPDLRSTFDKISTKVFLDYPVVKILFAMLSNENRCGIKFYLALQDSFANNFAENLRRVEEIKVEVHGIITIPIKINFKNEAQKVINYNRQLDQLRNALKSCV